ncbi:MAG: hypothetical protein IJS10_01590 [Alphaproteobacteria bacterium]|nr:hypothetical protein [Alphaproteobacteria bacterium]
MYKHSWRAHLSETWKCADIKAKTWWKAEIYEDSIFEVIPQAIADCITHNAEFDESKFTELQQEFKVIEFHDATPDKMRYGGENWNAVMLWNFLYRAMCIEPDEKDYQKILSNTMVALTKYYAKYNNESKEALKKLNKTYVQGLKKARQDILQYIEQQGVNLIKYLDNIKQISKEDWTIRAPQARLMNQKQKNGNACIIAQYPVHDIVACSARWVEYKIEYTNKNDISVAENGNKYICVCVPTYTLPDGIVEYDDKMKKYNEEKKEQRIKMKYTTKEGYENEEKTPIYEGKIFKLREGSDWKTIMKNEYPIHYSLSFKNLPKGYTKGTIENADIEEFGKEIGKVTNSFLSGNIAEYNPSMTATEYLNTLIKSNWRQRGRPTIYNEKTGDDMLRINGFRDMFNLTEDEYPDDKILKILTENDFDDENAFSALFN